MGSPEGLSTHHWHQEISSPWANGLVYWLARCCRSGEKLQHHSLPWRISSTFCRTMDRAFTGTSVTTSHRHLPQLSPSFPLWKTFSRSQLCQDLKCLHLIYPHGVKFSPYCTYRGSCPRSSHRTLPARDFPWAKHHWWKGQLGCDQPWSSPSNRRNVITIYRTVTFEGKICLFNDINLKANLILSTSILQLSQVAGT